MSNKQYVVPQASSPGSGGGGGGSGTVTSVGLTVNSTSPSGIFTVTGSPVTTSGTLNVNLAGTSGGVPYFSSGTVVSSSGQLANNAVVLGGGAGAAPKTAAGFTTDGTSQLTLGVATSSTGALLLAGATSGTATITPQAATGSPTLTLPNASGTFAISASAPIVLSATTGALTAPTAVTSAASLTSNALVKGAGGQASAASAVATDDGTTLTYTGTGGILSTTSGGLKAGANSGAAGVLTLNGSTSGAVTATAPAVAGTVTNPLAITNQLSTPGYALINGALPANGTGVFNTAAQNVLLYSNGTNWLFGNQNIMLGQSVPFHPAGGNLKFVAGNFTTAANTNLQTITGLQFTHVTSNAVNWNFHAVLVYSQATANDVVSFGIQAATNNPTNIFATGQQQITAGPPATFTAGTLATLTTTTATTIVSGTPGATGVNYRVELDGTLELAASANTINFMVSTATAADAVTVLRGSYVNIW